MKFIAKICSDGRLYNGAWITKSAIPDPLPYNVVVFDSFPDETSDGSDYIWDGETLTYSPAEKPPEDNGSEAGAP